MWCLYKSSWCHNVSGCALSVCIAPGQVMHTSSTAQHSTAQHSTAQHSTAQHSTAQHSAAQHSTALRHAARTAEHSTAQHSMAWHGMAKACLAQPSIALYSCLTVQPWHVTDTARTEQYIHFQPALKQSSLLCHTSRSSLSLFGTTPHR